MIIKNKFNSTKIIFGNNQRSTILKIIKKKTALIVCSKRTKREIILDKNFSFIKTNEVLWIDDVTPNPSLTYLEKKKKHFKNRKKGQGSKDERFVCRVQVMG